MKTLFVGKIADRSGYALYEGILKERGRYQLNAVDIPKTLKELEDIKNIDIHIESDFMVSLPFLSRFDRIEKNEVLYRGDPMFFMIKNKGLRRQVSFAFGTEDT